MSSHGSSITDLAAQVKSATEIISTHLQQNSLPSPSFAADAFPFFPGTGPSAIDPFSPPPPAILAARATLLSSCATLLQLIATPADHLIYSLGCAHHTSAALQYIYHFQIAHAVPIDGSISYHDLAKAKGLEETRLKRVLRLLITAHYFSEPKPGYVAHTAGSALLLSSQLNDTIGYLMEESFPAAAQLAFATSKFGASEERNATAWNIANNTTKPIFEFLEGDGQTYRRRRFLGLMQSMGGTEAHNVKHLVSGFNWEGLGKGTVVDVGGSTGHASFAVAEVAKELNFVVQDLENVIASSVAQQGRNEEEEKLLESGRVRFEAHSFFEEQSVKGVEVYLLRMILHDYSDKYAAKILERVVQAMGKWSRIVVMDGVTPEPGVVSAADEKKIRIMDTEMMICNNAVERDLSGWKALFAKADKRLKLKSLVTPPGCAQSIMELVLDD